MTATPASRPAEAARTGPTLAERLGFAPDERVAILHADDVGLCEATVDAFAELTALGTVTAGSVMVPAPGFETAAGWARRHPEADLGVHVTLTSEHPARRWRPLTAGEPVPGQGAGLADEDGWLPRTADRAALADPEAAGREMAAQLDRALAAGIDVTHADSHMYAAFAPALLPRLVDAAVARGLPPALWRPEGERWLRFPPAEAGRLAAGLDRRGVPLVDRVARIRPPADGDLATALDGALAVLDGLAPGVTYLLLHPAADSPELRATAADWRRRVADFETFRHPRLVRRLAERGIRAIGCRPLRALLRKALAGGGGDAAAAAAGAAG